jgi:thiamine pyrophosphate-dependent acetolactate synthase large subunit-like protein
LSTGAQALVAALEDAGVEVVFGLPGVHNLAAWEALRTSPIRLIGVRHEQAAAYAADGYARTTGRVGVALVTTGPGAANTLGALGEAWASRSPVVVIATDIPTGLRREGVHRGSLHELPGQAKLFEPVTKRTLRAERAREVRAATETATLAAQYGDSGPRPVYLEIPTDVLAAAIDGEEHRNQAWTKYAEQVHVDLDRAAELIDAAQRPLVWAGGGSIHAVNGVVALAEKLAAPIFTTYTARGVAGGHPLALGLPPHLPKTGALWDQADVVVSIGSDLDGMNTQNWLHPHPPTLVAFNIDPDDAAKNYTPDLVVPSAAFAGDVAERLAQRDAWVDVAALRREVLDELRREFPAELRFLDAVPAEAVIFADMCIPGYWLAGFHPVPEPRRLAYPMGWGTLGFAFPAALGAAAAGLDAPVLSVSGDGGFLFAAGELATVAQERLPLTALIVDDGGYGMLRYDQDAAGRERHGVDLHTPDFAALARAFGVRSQTVQGLDDAFEAALGQHLADPEPSVLVAKAALQPPPTTSPRWYRRKQPR